MRIPYEWLQEMVPVTDPPEALAERLSCCALEVDEIERPLAGVVVGEIRAQRPHPNADRLTLCEVEVGPGDTRAIVCGAKNMGPGDRVALATPGTALPAGLTIKKSKIRGEVSEGMLCSASELELGGDASGILILDETAPIGSPAAGALGLGSAVLDVDLLPDRGDCASVYGMAREVAALYDLPLSAPASEVAESGTPLAGRVTVEVSEPERCLRYMARLVHGVRVGPSPEWLVRRLASVGARAINNVVDVTNLVLHELGQPLHAFDAARIPDGRIGVRTAREGETLALLDDRTVSLAPDDLVIADAERPIALAGVMGGAETAVQETTRDVILEAACFEPRGVRRSARRHGLRTDSSYRFERGVDPEGVARGLDRAARLLAELAGGEVAQGKIDLPTPREPARIALPLTRVPQFLGIDLAPDEIVGRLRRVGVATELADGVVHCRPPSWRWDVHEPADLLEEIVRLGGYDAVPARLPEGPLQGVRVSPERTVRVAARHHLASLGWSEVVNLAFLSAADLGKLGLAEDDPRRARAVELRNPLGAELALLRTSLLPALLEGAGRNLRHGAVEVLHFEAGASFLRDESAELPDETRVLAGVAVPSEEKSFWPADADAHFFGVKHAVESLFEAVRRPVALRPAEAPSPFLHPGAAAELRSGRQSVGELGRIHPDVARGFDLPEGTVVFELSLGALAARPAEPRRYAEPPRFPSVRRDLALLVPKDVSTAEVEDQIRRAAGGRLESVTLFDQYQGKGIPDDRKSVAFRLTLRAPDRTLEERDISKVTDKVVRALERALGAEQR